MNGNASKKSVLILDDEPDILEIMSFFLKDEFSITCLPNGAMGENSIHKKSWDVIITDINMPIMDGLEFLRRLKKSPSRDAKVFVVSGSVSKEHLKELVSLGVTRVHVKPINAQELLDEIKNALGMAPLESLFQEE